MIFQVIFDTSTILLNVESEQEVYDILTNLEDENFVMINNKLYYDWGDDFVSECCEVVDISTEYGIIQWESH
jgi:hypothetical protein